MTDRPPRTPPPHRVARELYGEALGADTPSALADAMDAWHDLDDSEQRYVVAHLIFLQIQSQARSSAATMRVLDAVDDLTEVVERLAPRMSPSTAPVEPPVIEVEAEPTGPREPAAPQS